jgi:fibronectin-binding autotransporter adhesin
VTDGATLSVKSGSESLQVASLTFNQTATLATALDTPGTSELILVGGNLTLGGFVDIEGLGGFGSGTYRLMKYEGTLTADGAVPNLGLTFGNVAGGFEYQIVSAVEGGDKVINLIATAATAQFWDGSHLTPQGIPGGSGGNGTWSNTSTNWTNAAGTANSNSLGTLTLTFGGSAGTVTMADGSSVASSSMAFLTNGYELTSAGSGNLTFHGPGTIDVKDNSILLSARTVGSGTLTKMGSGTLTLTNAYHTGGTIVEEGTLAVGSGTLSGGNLIVGRTGAASLDITGGGSVAGTGIIGDQAGSSGRLTVSGPNSSWNGRLIIGNSGTGEMVVTNGAEVNTVGSGITHGAEIGSAGSSTMTGGSLTNTGPWLIGLKGDGSFTQTAGTVTAGITWVGIQPTSEGVLALGGDAVWNSRTVSVGIWGAGAFEISDNAQVTIESSLHIGGRTSLFSDPPVPPTLGEGRFIMTGGSLTIKPPARGLSTFQIGMNTGNGIAEISGGSVKTGYTWLGGRTAEGVLTEGTLTMTGGTWTNTIDLVIGEYGHGEFHLSGGTMTSVNTRIATMGVTGTATMTGGTWTNSGILSVGDAGQGTLDMSGGTLSNAAATLGRVAGSSGSVTVSGGEWTTAQTLLVGSAGVGSLTLSGTGMISATQTVLGSDASGTGTLNLDGGTLTTGSVTKGLGNGTVTFNGGVLKLTGDQAALFSGFETGDVQFNGAGATIDTQGFAVSTASGITGTGGLTKLGTGNLTLGGTNTYAGTTTVSAGGLTVNGSLAGGVVLADGTQLGGSGVIAGPVSVGTGVTINPGNSPGTLTLGTLTLNATSILNFELSTPNVVGSGLNDLIVVNGDLTLDGTLNILDLAGFGTGTYRLFDYTGGLTDNGLLFGIVPGAFGLSLDTSVASQVNLIVSAPAAQYWDGPFTSPQGHPGGSGGTGVWASGTTNWTNANGNANAAWLGTTGAVFAGTSGTVTIADGFTATAKSLTFETDGYVLAAEGNGALDLSAGGGVEVSTGTATISARITGNGNLSKTGAGTLNITGINDYSGATVVRSGTVNLTGSISHGSSPLDVAPYFGDNAALHIAPGASIEASLSTIAWSAGATGLVTMTGGTWTSSDELRVGDYGHGTLNISEGTISNTIGNIARSAGSTGTVTMSGGTWTNSQQFVVGNAGNGTLTFTGGTISSVHSTIGAGSDSIGSATVKGGTWTNSGELRIGDWGHGTLTVESGTLSNTIGNIARSAGSVGTVTMTGGTWTNTERLIVGNAGSGVLHLNDGDISSVLSTIGDGAGSSGVAHVAGGSWTSTDELRIGEFGSGTLNVSGGEVSNTIGNVARSAGSTGIAFISGGTWSNSEGLHIGNSGHGTLTLVGDGVVTVSDGTGTVNIADAAGSTGTLNFGDYDTPTTSGTLAASTIVFGAGDGVVNFNQMNNFIFDLEISGGGSVVQRGSGTTTFTGNSTYTGPTIVAAGTLIVDGSLTSDVTVENGATLQGDGIVGNIVLESGSLLRPVDCFDATSLVWQADATMTYALSDGYGDILDLAGEFLKDGTGAFAFTFLDAGWVEGQTYDLVTFETTNFAIEDFSVTNGGGFSGIFAFDGNVLTFTLTAIPEPSTGALLGLGIAGLALRRRRSG